MYYNLTKRTNKKHTYDYIKRQFENKGYKLLSTEYKNAHTKLKVQCPNNHIYEVKYNDFQQGHLCDYCYRDKLRFTYKNIKHQIEENGYKILSNVYKNSQTKLKVQCKNGHVYTTTWNRFQQGNRCPFCIHNISIYEDEIMNIVRKITNTIILQNDRTQITNPLTNRKLELDIFLPDLKKAIEFNGIYWHSRKNVKNRDLIKKEQCKEKNIELFIINERNWLENKQNVIEDIKKFIRGKAK